MVTELPWHGEKDVKYDVKLPRRGSTRSSQCRSIVAGIRRESQRLDLYPRPADDEQHVAPMNQTWVPIRVSRPVSGPRKTKSLR
jgi:hypothetical protein